MSQASRRINGERFSCLLLLMAMLAQGGIAKAAVWSSTDRWAHWQNAGYDLWNNVWGSGFGPQTIWANSGTNWGVWSQQPSTSGVKSYPNASKNINKMITSYTGTGSWNFSVPGSSNFNVSYDIWVPSEVMIWVYKAGNVGPIGSLQQSNVSI